MADNNSRRGEFRDGLIRRFTEKEDWQGKGDEKKGPNIGEILRLVGVEVGERPRISGNTSGNGAKSAIAPRLMKTSNIRLEKPNVELTYGQNVDAIKEKVREEAFGKSPGKYVKASDALEWGEKSDPIVPAVENKPRAPRDKAVRSGTVEVPVSDAARENLNELKRQYGKPFKHAVIFKSMRLTADQARELRSVFGDEVDYDKIRVHITIGTAVGMVNGKRPFVVGNHMFFPISVIKNDEEEKGNPLVHEGAHVWQFQGDWGWKYLRDAARDQFKAGIQEMKDPKKPYDPYRYKENVEKGIPFGKWRAEQQAQWVENNMRLPNELEMRGIFKNTEGVGK